MSVPLDSLTYQGPPPPPKPRGRRSRPPHRPQDHAPPAPGQSLNSPRGGPNPFILLYPIKIYRTGKPRPCHSRARARARPAVPLAAGSAQGVTRAPQGCARSPAPCSHACVLADSGVWEKRGQGPTKFTCTSEFIRSTGLKGRRQGGELLPRQQTPHPTSLAGPFGSSSFLVSFNS